MTYRAVFFSSADAQSAAQRLTTDGFTASVVRHPADPVTGDRPSWVVLTDAPEIVLELLVERYDGWLES